MVAVGFLLLSLVAYLTASPSYACREKTERQMKFEIRLGLSDPRALEVVEGPIFAVLSSNMYLVELGYEYPNRSGGVDERTALGALEYISGETCEFTLTSVGE